LTLREFGAQPVKKINCFKAYDIRGRVPEDLNEEIAYAIGQAYATYVKPGKVVVGHDIRLSSPALATAVSDGLRDAGSDVMSVGLCGTEEVYFATWHLGADGGIMVTASHNPVNFNGMKFVREEARPISGDSGLVEIHRLVEHGKRISAAERGGLANEDVSGAYIQHLLSYVELDALRPLKLVVNAGNGGAGLVVDQLEPHLPFEFIKIQHEPDGTFPNGVPNPLLPENRSVTAEAILASRADMGVAWDGDFDRCFFFDEAGKFIEGYYIVGLLAQSLLAREPRSKIIHDPRLIWNTVDIVTALGGIPVQSKTGHAFIKECMRRQDALYGGEMSAHHYFIQFSYCDSGMIPWLLVAGIICSTGQSLSTLVAERVAKFPVSGEINRRLNSPMKALETVRARYAQEALAIDETAGLSFEFRDWRFNLRLSNTEPVVRLNVESRAARVLVDCKTEEILALLDTENQI
jgi:phosphomannomutase